MRVAGFSLVALADDQLAQFAGCESAGQLVARINDLTATDALRAGTLQPVLLDWVGQHSPPLNLLIRKSLVRQPRLRAFVDFMVAFAEARTRVRLPAGLPLVPVAERPDWFITAAPNAQTRRRPASGYLSNLTGCIGGALLVSSDEPDESGCKSSP